MPLYNAKSQLPNEFVVTKFDDDLNVESSYLLISNSDGLVCECPAGIRPSCRHRDMLPFFVKYNRVNSNWVLDWDSGKQWRQYVGPLKGDDSKEQDEPVEPIAAAYTGPEPGAVTGCDMETGEKMTLAEYNAKKDSESGDCVASKGVQEPALSEGYKPFASDSVEVPFKRRVL